MIGPRALLAIAGAGTILAAVLGVRLHLAADARMEKRAAEWEATAGDYLAAAQAWEQHFRASEKNRGKEGETARRAVSEAAQACDARVARARASARAIKEIVNAPVPTDPRGCPVRGRVDARSLSDALTPGRSPD